MFTTLKWQNYAYTRCSAFVELTKEFYATFKFELPNEFTANTLDVIRYRLMGTEFMQSITKFNLAMGFINRARSETNEYIDSAYDYVEPFFSTHVGLW